MILFKITADLHQWIEIQRKKYQPGGNRTIGFVPTMGALHEGHIFLIKASKEKDEITVCSIFVNPAQFNDPNDFEKYPVTIEKDIEMLEEAGCDIVFLPSVSEIYPEGPGIKKKYDLGYLETVLDGKFRPGHFQGVCLVVERLLKIVKPDNLYLGQKDYQQCMVITRLVELMNWQDTIAIHICPTLREPDGLAMSSRNRRLNETERKKSVAIYQCLINIKQNIRKRDLAALKQEATITLQQAGFNPDYVEIADAATLEFIEHWDGRQKLVVLIAAFLGEVRLIDNMVLN
jgi:pantoate--beta-alanine ligase